MHIQPVALIRDRELLPIPDYCRQHADDMPVGNAYLPPPAVVSAEDVIIFTHFQNTVEHMLRKGTPVQDVSQILGHSNISVTETYLRVDIEHMRLCSLSLEGLL